MGKSYYNGSSGVVKSSNKAALPTSSSQTIVHMKWEGASSLVQTNFIIDHKTKSGTITTDSADSLHICDGSFTYHLSGDGTWALDCPNELYAKGTLKYNKNAEYFVGTGKDSLDNSISFYLDTSATTNTLKEVNN